ncbi:MAG: TFIIB-type zinc ribbon-containing protein [Rikenellaceae bacterium]
MQQNSKCPNCGGVMILNSEQTQFLCPYCDNIIYINNEPKIEFKTPIVTKNIESKPKLPSNVVLFEKPANLYKESISLGGHIKLYSDRMHFKTHAFNFQKTEVIIYYDNIIYIEAPNSILANGLNVTIDKGIQYKFIVSGRGQIIDLIHRQTDL